MLDKIEELFGSRDLLEILGIQEKDAENPGEVRAAYLKLALRYHPDKSDSGSTEKFHLIGKIYELFQDQDLRNIYLDSGDWPDSDGFRMCDVSFGRISENGIDEFKKLYQGSGEERNTIKDLYKKGDGDLIYIMDNLFFAEILEDEDRIRKIIGDLIDSGDMKAIEAKPGFAAKWRKRVAKAKKEAKEAEGIIAKMARRASC